MKQRLHELLFRFVIPDDAETDRSSVDTCNECGEPAMPGAVRCRACLGN